MCVDLNCTVVEIEREWLPVLCDGDIPPGRFNFYEFELWQLKSFPKYDFSCFLAQIPCFLVFYILGPLLGYFPIIILQLRLVFEKDNRKPSVGKDLGIAFVQPLVVGGAQSKKGFSPSSVTPRPDICDSSFLRVTGMLYFSVKYCGSTSYSFMIMVS